VATKGDELVKAIADGRVILEAWTFETEFIIGIQHSNELPPVSKHNSVVLKNTDDLVSGGEIISISGDSGKLSIGQHLDFELWNKNNLINPQQFITFI
jgi:lipoprotein NlpD